MITQEKFNHYATLRQIHRRIFCVLEDYRRAHDSFRFSVRKQNKKGRLTYGLIFTGDDYYVSVGLSNENDVKNKTRTVSFIFRIENGNIARLGLQVSYSKVAGVGAEKMQRYRALCQQFQIVPQELENGNRIRGLFEIALNGNDWENPLRGWLDNNFGALKDGFADVLIDEAEFSGLLDNQVNRGILSHDNAGYSVKEDYTPAFEVGNGDQQAEVAIVDGVDDEDGNEDEGEVFQNEEWRLNLIVFGAPGTGKSHKVEKDRKVFGERYERVTFYPTYSYAQFVGAYKPVMNEVDVVAEDDILSEDELAKRLKTATDDAMVKGIDQAVAVMLFAEKYSNSIEKVNRTQMFNKSGLPNTYNTYLGKGLSLAKVRLAAKKKETTIVYKFVPGPFLRVLVNALNEESDEAGKKKDWCLVIEEINRANAAAVFGDVFQLLDRALKDDAEKNVKKDTSEYAIAASEDVKKYLGEALTEAGENALLELTGSIKRLKIPANMYIWATMNSADQGVFPMDTAFKRRWAFEYLGLDDGAGEDGEGDWKIGMKDDKFDYKWEDFRRYVNRLLALAKVNEDKLMGPFFMKKPANGTTIDKNEFESKVLMYLWEDAGKMCRRQLFGDISTYSELIDAWEENGIEIFSSNLRDRDTIDKGKDNPKKIRNAKKLYEALVKKPDEELK